MCDGDGDWCPADRGGRSKLCASGADVATCGDEFGPSWPGEDASCPSVTSGRLYRIGEIAPGVGNVDGPGFASRNALYAASLQSFRNPASEVFSAEAAYRTCCIAFARPRSPPAAAFMALRWKPSRSIAVTKSAYGWCFATSAGW